MNVALIPARGGSKGIPKKNIVDLHGKPLIWYTIKAAQDSKLVDDVYVSTDDKEISDIAIRYGCKVIDRPDELAKDMSLTLPVI